ncbi:Myc-type basic helix-loop-helix (bHLH) domain [Trinorchestia longiramus]|nr:Myc-type basic helix-loop-helix (bHLH) domain [Trinorchestia longiramus]
MGDNQTISEVYCQQLTRLKAVLQEKLPSLINRKGVILHHDNARPHTSRATKNLIEEFGWEVMHHPPYSPDLAPTDFHLFRSLQNHLMGQRLTSREEVQSNVSYTTTKASTSRKRKQDQSKGQHNKRHKGNGGEEGPEWREHHNQQERRRRDTLGGQFIRLANTLGLPSTASRLLILEKTAECFRMIKEAKAAIATYEQTQAAALREAERMAEAYHDSSSSSWDSDDYDDFMEPYLNKMCGNALECSILHKDVPVSVVFSKADVYWYLLGNRIQVMAMREYQLWA